MDSIPGSGRFPGEGNGNPLQYSCLGNYMDRRVHGVAKEMDITLRLNNKINEDGAKKAATGQYLVRQERKD